LTPRLWFVIAPRRTSETAKPYTLAPSAAITVAMFLIALLSLSPVKAVGADVDGQWTSAIIKHDLATIERLLGSGVDVNLATQDGKTALMLAAGDDAVSLTGALLKAGAKVNATNERGGTALMYAAVSGDPATITLLLKHGADINAKGANGWGALMIACAKGYDQVVQLLLAQGADPNAADIYGWTPLMRAVYEDRLPVVRTLLEHGSVKLDAADDHGLTALHLSAVKGYVDIARELISHGADVRRTDMRGRTALTIATMQGSTELINLLRQSAQR
jgi:ankyrin repeat protein